MVNTRAWKLRQLKKKTDSEIGFEYHANVKA